MGSDNLKPPNIVLVLADDMGFSDLGCYGGEVPTPNLDRLASKGVRFTHSYNNAVCMPSRASLLTGLHYQQVLEPAKLESLLPRGNVTLPEVLGHAGYRTLMVGKWHNGPRPWELPTQRGFQHYYGLLSGSSNYFNPGLPRPGEPEPAHKSPGDMRPWGMDGKIVFPYTPEDPHFYATDAFTDEAVRFLDRYGRNDEPFFLYLAYTAPHFPMQARPEDIERFRGCYMAGWDQLREERYERMLEMGVIDPRWQLSPRDELAPRWVDLPDKKAWDLKMAVYAAMIYRLDQGIGRVMGMLQALGKEEDTVVIFLSDNGGCAGRINRTPDVPPGPVNSYCTVDLPWANLSNTPFRRFKSFDHEGGISTPMIVSWPRVIREGGSICREVGHIMDFMPTFIEMAGGEYPTERSGCRVFPREGRSFLPLLRGERVPERGPIFWELQGCRALRFGDWKIVSQGPPRQHRGVEILPRHDAWELYDIAADRCELQDLSQRNPKKAEELGGLWEEWYQRCIADQQFALRQA